MYKRILSGALAAVFSLSLLTACGSSSLYLINVTAEDNAHQTLFQQSVSGGEYTCIAALSENDGLFFSFKISYQLIEHSHNFKPP